MEFVNRNDWFPSKNSVRCIKHFDEKIILKGKPNKMNWDLHPIPTIHSEKWEKRLFCWLQQNLRKPSKHRRIIHQPNELQDFLLADTMKDSNHLEEEKFSLKGFEWKKKKKKQKRKIIF